MKTLYAAIGRRLRECRHLKGMTIQQLADAVNLDPSFLGQIERGVGVPSLATLAKLAGKLRIPLRDLFVGSTAKGMVDFYVREATDLLAQRSKKDRQRALNILKELFPR